MDGGDYNIPFAFLNKREIMTKCKILFISMKICSVQRRYHTKTLFTEVCVTLSIYRTDIKCKILAFWLFQNLISDRENQLSYVKIEKRYWTDNIKYKYK